MRGRKSVRFAAPVGVACAIALGSWLPTISASATPKLPSVTPAQLLAKVRASRVKAFSGTVQWSANLGLPSISGLQSGSGGGPESSQFKATDLLSGTQQIQVWVDGQSKQRFEFSGSLAESDLVHRGRQAWLWNSSTQHVTHLIFKGGQTVRHERRAGMGALFKPGESRMLSYTPSQLAEWLVRGLRHFSQVRVMKPETVAGRSAYVLSVSPKPGTPVAARSTISNVTFAVDSKTGLPLQATINAKGQKSPALQVGFTSISFATPPSSRFQAPHGSSVRTKVVQPGLGAHAPAARNGSQHGLGHGWKGSKVRPNLRVNGAHGARFSPWDKVVMVNAANLGAPGAELERLGSTVKGSFGTAKLIHSSLLNALVLPGGRTLVGTVTPNALETMASHRMPAVTQHR